MKHQHTKIHRAVVRASPSLALIKYWGKSDTRSNLPATPSIALTLRHLCSETKVMVLDKNSFEPGLRDLMVLDGKAQDMTKFDGFFETLRGVFGQNWCFWAESRNNFPTAAGLASSSSGFAALTYAISQALDRKDEPEVLSSLARIGSGSAARSLFGGFTLLNADSESAVPLEGPEFWPELGVLIVRIQDASKEVSSRKGMESSRLSSPYYDSWLLDAQEVCTQAREALTTRDLAVLGPLIRKSYLRMFSTMFSADPPLIYWKPQSLAVILACEELRKQGIQAWETMDAGPQVKIFCLKSDRDRIISHLSGLVEPDRMLWDEAGPGPRNCQAALLAQGDPILQEEAARWGLVW